MPSIPQDDDNLVLTELVGHTPREPLDAQWFTERRSTASLPPPRPSSVPPMGDEDVDPWLL